MFSCFNPMNLLNHTSPSITNPYQNATVHYEKIGNKLHINILCVKDEANCTRIACMLEDQCDHPIISHLKFGPWIRRPWAFGGFYGHKGSVMNVYTIFARHLASNTTLKTLEIQMIKDYEDSIIELLSVVDKHPTIKRLVLENYQNQASAKLTSVVAEMSRNPNSKITSLIMDGAEFRKK